MNSVAYGTSKIRQYFYSSVVLAVLMISLVITALLAQPTAALSSEDPVYIAGDNTFYAYVIAGETVNIGFTLGNQPEGATSGIKPEPVTTTIDAPGASEQTCVIPANVAIGNGCSFNNLVATKTGIWQIGFKLPSDAYIHPGLSSAAPTRWGGNAFSWHINITDASGNVKTGRVWSNLYTIWQPLAASALTDFTNYYVSEDGYIYRAIVRGYNGGLSTWSVDGYGIVDKGTCTPAYQSIESNSTTMVPAFGSCGGSYKLFFEQPSDDLPASATRWDGTTDWIKPPVIHPEVDNLKFTPDKNSGVQSGTISFILKNFVGQYTVKIDTNNDGNYDGSEDVAIQRQIKDLKDGNTVQTVKFNGLDGNGDNIPTTQQIGIQVDVSRVAEIHLLSGDVEGRQGGIELTRLSGDNAPNSDVCWNDSDLPSVPGDLDTNLQLDGTSCPDSTGGVHSWLWNADKTITWGGSRYIDDWAYATARVSGTSQIIYPTSETAAQAATAQRGINLGVIIVTFGIIIGIIVGIIYFLKRRKRQDQQFLPPTNGPNLPPPTINTSPRF